MTTVVQSVGNNALSTAGATLSITVASTTAGNLGVVTLGIDIAYTGIAVTDNATGGSSTWTSALVTTGGAGGRTILIAQCLSLKAGATSISVTLSGSSSAVTGFSGFNEVSSGTWTQDKTGTALSTITTGVTVTASAADAGTTDFVLSAAVVGNGNSATGVTSPPTGYTAVAVNQNDNTSTSGGIAYRINSSSVTDSCQWVTTSGNTTTNCPAAIISFKVTAGFTGSAAITESADTVTGTGTQKVTGSGAITEGADAAAAIGSQSVSGSSAITESADTVAASGSRSVSGSAAITEGHDTSAGAGSQSLSGSGAMTEGADTVSGAGAQSVTGSGSPTESADTVAGSGATAAAGGTAAVTESADSVGGTGSQSVSGSGAITESADTGTGTGAQSVSGSAAVTENPDTASAAGALSVSGSGAITEGADAAAATGAQSVNGSAAMTEGVDTVAATGVSGSGGVAAITESADIASGSGVQSITGIATITEGPDTANGSGGAGGGPVPAGKHRKRYVVRDGERLLTFFDKADAYAARRAIEAKQKAKPADTAPTPLPKRIKVKPTVIALPDLAAMATASQAQARFEELNRTHQNESLVRLFDELRQQEDEAVLRAIVEHERSDLPVIAEALKHVITHLARRKRR